MKKVLFLSLLLFVLLSGIAIGSSINGDFEGSPIVKLFSGSNELVASDVPAIIYKNRTMVPISLLKQMGLHVTWDASQYAVHIELPKPDLTDAQLNEIAKSVYEVFGSTSDPTKATQGSGFIINGTMVTNAHVAGDSAYTQVQIDGQWQKVSEYSFVNKQTDVMGFKVSGGKSLPYSTVLPEVGDRVYAIGYPAGKLTITKGNVLKTAFWGTTLIYSTAFVDSGNSGGILVNNNGEIIGITKASENVQGVDESLSIPISYALQELK